MRTGTQPVDIIGSVVGELLLTTQGKKRNFYIILTARHMYTHDTYTRYYTCLGVPASRCIRVSLMHNACMRVSRMMCLCAHTSRRDHMRLCHMMTCASRRDYMNLVLVAVLVQP